jgi:hypothetical protein
MVTKRFPRSIASATKIVLSSIIGLAGSGYFRNWLCACELSEIKTGMIATIESASAVRTEIFMGSLLSDKTALI